MLAFPAKDGLKFGKMDRYANTVQVNTTFPGRAPAVLAPHRPDTAACVDRSGMGISVLERR